MRSAVALALLVLPPGTARAQSVDTFENTAVWQAAPASGVTMHLSADAGRSGNALRVDFDFNGGGGWAAFRREFPMTLPDNYEISFWLKGDAPRNTLEFKLIDSTGENVWWVNRPEFEYAGDWRRVSFRKRHVAFAWGPKGGGDIRDVAAIEFAITAGSGGKGTVWIDDLQITPREIVLPYHGMPVTTRAENALTLDFTRNREYGGVIVEWATRGRGRSYEVQTSMDGRTWQTVRRVNGSLRDRDYLQLPESESRFLRFLFEPGARSADVRNVRVMPIEWGGTPNSLFATLAADSPRGSYPKYFLGTQSYWTIAGENGARREALMNEEGAVEVGKRSFSIEPFLRLGDTVLTWADAEITQSLEDDYLPIPSATWSARGIELRTTAWVHRDVLYLRYRVANRAATTRPVSLLLAVRPFQVNPASQFLNGVGGFAPITRLRYDGSVVYADSQKVIPLERPAEWYASTFDQGDVIERIRAGTITESTVVTDSVGGASGALVYRLQLEAGQSGDIHVAVPFEGGSTVEAPAASFAAAREAWRAELDRFEIRLPASAARIANTVRSTLAYILINRDSAAIQPGSRAYERSWIRDGSLTSAALLRLGHAKEVREFIDWYAPYQYADGKVPCCVDHRGADPVPENDSHGELIYAITEYFRFTKDTATARRHWPRIEKAILYMDSLRESRRTEEFAGTPLFGLLPQSISHEGYSAKPMHSYWDDFFALKGYKDAAWLASQLRADKAAEAIARSRDAFQADLLGSLETAMRAHGIDYLPGAAELGDFDATSTTVGLNPAGAQHQLPEAALRNTFERYWRNFVARRDSAWDAYTPYEWRVVGTLIRLGEEERAHQLADWFMDYQRPAAWNHWAEVVTRDTSRSRFLGDMPHTWVGSDFIRSVLDMFAYDEDGTVILAAGIRDRWLDSPSDTVGVRGIHTPHGVVGYRVYRRDANTIVLRFDASTAAPPKGFIVRSPIDRPVHQSIADGRGVDVTSRGEIRLSLLPRELILSYR